MKPTPPGCFAVLLVVAACGSQERPAQPGTDTQIVAQWSLSTDGGLFEVWRFMAAEEHIRGACAQVCTVDGHDVGGGTLNVLLYSDDIDGTVSVLSELERHGRIPRAMRIGVARYSNPERTDWTYEAVHPAGLGEFGLFAPQEGP